MTTIQFIDGKPILRDGKVGTGQGCCCSACCQHYCNKMCCNQIKWVMPEYTDSFTTVDTNCRATFELPESSVRIRVRVRCSGYVYGTYGETPYDCDTDCQIIEVEYSDDGGTTWTTTPPSEVEGIAWSIYCPGDSVIWGGGSNISMKSVLGGQFKSVNGESVGINPKAAGDLQGPRAASYMADHENLQVRK